jgi:rubredoxin
MACLPLAREPSQFRCDFCGAGVRDIEAHSLECAVLRGILGGTGEHGDLPENFYTCPKCNAPIAESERFDHEFAHEF